MAFVKQNWFLVGILLILAFVGIRYTSYLNLKNQMVLDENLQKGIERQNKERELKVCLELAIERYDGDWELSCESQKKSSKCTLPRYLANPLFDDLQEREDRCHKYYSIDN